MRRLLFCILTVLSISTSRADAQDPSEWSGAYAGATIGSTSDTFEGPVTFPALVTDSGSIVPGATESVKISTSAATLGGAELGYNWTHRRWLVGAECQITGALSKGTTTLGSQAVLPFVPVDMFSSTPSWTTPLRARVGLIDEDWLFYAAGGVVWTSVTVSGTFPLSGTSGPTASGSERHVLTGSVFGAGVERHVGNGAIGVEYRHAQYGHASFTLSEVAATSTGAGARPIIAAMNRSSNEISLRVTVQIGQR